MGEMDKLTSSVMRAPTVNGFTNTYIAGNDGFTSLSAMVRDALSDAKKKGCIDKLPSRAEIGRMTAELARSSFITADYDTWAQTVYKGDEKKLSAALMARAKWYGKVDHENRIPSQPLKNGKNVPFVKIKAGETIIISYDQTAENPLIIKRLSRPENEQLVDVAV